MVLLVSVRYRVEWGYKPFSATVALSTKAHLRSDSVRLFCLVHPRKDYLIKRAYVEFICPSGETQIGINHRFNEQDEDEFRLQDVSPSSVRYG